MGFSPPPLTPARHIKAPLSFCCGFARLFIGSPLLYHRHSPFQFGLQLGLPSRIFIWDFHLGFPLGISIWDSRLVRSQVNNSMRNPVQKKNNNMLMRTQQIITIYPAATLRDCRRECFPYEFENKEFLTPLGFYSMFWKVKKKCKSRRQRD